MSGNTDKLKGNAKETAGDVTGDRDLQAEGKTDQAKGGLKQAAHKVGEGVSNAAETTKEAVTGKKTSS